MTSIPASEGAGSAYRPDIDGLRALAVLVVVAHHAWPSLAPGGFFGVDVFFVISGFLITGILKRDRARGPGDLLCFYARRVRRILPALVAMVAAVIATGLIILTPNDLALAGRSLESVGALASNRFFLSLTGYFSPEAVHQPLLHTWSLSIEEQFYLIWPLLLVVLLHPRLARFAPSIIAGLALVSFAETVRLSALGGLNEAFYYLRSRLWELLLGAFLAVVPMSRLPEAWRGPCAGVGVVAILFAASPAGGAAAWPGVMALFACAGAALVIAGQGQGPAGRLLASPAAVGVGLISYSLYLWHWPLLSLPQLVLSRPLSAGEASLAVALAFAVAWASWRWIERPFRSSGRARPAVTVGVGVVVLASLWVGGALLARSDGLPSRARPGVMAAQAAGVPVPEASCHNGAGAAVPPAGPCTTGPRSSLVIVWGDSHAAHLMPTVRVAASGNRVRQITKSSCPPVALPGSDPACAAFNREVLAEIGAQGPRTVVLSGRWTEYVRLDGGDTGRFEQRMRAGLAALRRALGPDVRIVIWGPTPEFAFEPPLCWARAVQAALDPERCLRAVPRDPGLVDGVERALLAAAGDGVEVVLPYRSMCAGGLCETRSSDGRFRFRDDDHLTPAGARGLAGLLRGRL